MNFSKVCVFGLGYIGLPYAATFATHGLRVVGVDINPKVVATLQNGGIHIHEPSLRTVVQAAVKSGNLTVSTRPEEADAFIIAVPTPFKQAEERPTNGQAADPKADMSYVTAAAEAIVPYLRRGNLVMLESTSPPRTTVDLVAPILEKSGLRAGPDFHLAYTPERVLPGQILRELIENARVLGGIDRASTEAARDLYTTFVRGQIVLTDATTAEMVKLMENTTRDINIAIANEFSRLADHFGVDVWEAIGIANLHPRINILRPGPGVGGHCISVDPWFLVEAAPTIATLIRTARQVNDGQPDFVVDLVARTAERLEGKRIAALGLAFKPDVDDLRESPAVAICQALALRGADVKAHEPFKADAAFEGFTTTPTLDAAIQDADILLILVAHRAFKELDPQKLVAQTKARTVIDTVDICDRAAWRAAGFHVVTLGVGKTQ
ncbi:MAG: nucleotide sugar dehydrogenase [Chloroflexota bacterium]